MRFFGSALPRWLLVSALISLVANSVLPLSSPSHASVTEVARVDARAEWDRVELGRFHAYTSWVVDARRAAEAAVATAQVDLSGGLASYQSSLAVARCLVENDPSNARWQRDFLVRCGSPRTCRGAASLGIRWKT